MTLNFRNAASAIALVALAAAADKPMFRALAAERNTGAVVETRWSAFARTDVVDRTGDTGLNLYVDGGAGSWQFSAAEPYDNLVRHADGTVQSFATLERPKLLFADPKRPHTPTHLINGASPVWLDGPDPCAVCGPTGEVHCSHCKQQPGIDWTYTLMTPLVPP